MLCNTYFDCIVIFHLKTAIKNNKNVFNVNFERLNKQIKHLSLERLFKEAIKNWKENEDNSKQSVYAKRIIRYEEFIICPREKLGQPCYKWKR